MKEIIFVIASFMFYACSFNIHVVDNLGLPIPNAKIYNVSLSMDIGPNMTDKNGNGSIPGNVQGGKWLHVTANGYKDYREDFPSKLPTIVIMEKK